MEGYIPYQEEDYSGAEITKCVLCPPGCNSCSDTISNGVATCTTCEEGKGLFLQGGMCAYCDSDDGQKVCLSCSDDGDCEECAEGWRLDEGSCQGIFSTRW